MPPRRAPGTRYVPARVEDLAALDAQIDEFIQSAGKASETQRLYTLHWNTWLDFCSQRGYQNPLDAPIDAFHALVGAAAEGSIRKDQSKLGTALAVSTLDQMLAAIREHYRRQGLSVPYERPEHIARFRALRAGYARTHGREKIKAKPLGPHDVIALLTAEITPTAEEIARAALTLLALDSTWPLRHIMSLSVADIAASSDEVTIPAPDGTLTSFICDHESKANDLPHPCLVCALNSHLALCDPDHVLFAAPGFRASASSGRTQWLRGLADSWPLVRPPQGDRGIGQILRLREAEGLSAEQFARLYAGTRLGLYLACFPAGLRLARARAVAAASWSVGLRARSDLRAVERRHVNRDEQGLVITLPNSKGDRAGEGRTMGLPYASDSRTCPVRHLDVWLALTDAAAGPDARTPDSRPLLTSVTPLRIHTDRLGSLVSQSIHEDFALLCELAGLDGFTPHSLRTGYAEEASAQGRSLLEIQATLRHAKPETTLSYVRRSQSHSAITKLAERLEGDAA